MRVFVYLLAVLSTACHEVQSVVLSQTVRLDPRHSTEYACVRPAGALQPLHCTMRNTGSCGGNGHIDFTINSRRNNENAVAFTWNEWDIPHDGTREFDIRIDEANVVRVCGADLHDCYVYVNYVTGNVCGCGR